MRLRRALFHPGRSVPTLLSGFFCWRGQMTWAASRARLLQLPGSLKGFVPPGNQWSSGTYEHKQVCGWSGNRRAGHGCGVRGDARPNAIVTCGFMTGVNGH